ncbi:MAG: c-type cytochrome [Chloroflexota bacterium]|nr:c-type cytochrome [Chloroflexota bacterium]MDE2886233.1 c-type cytochrome [Chloroflexota bacterium]
MNGRRAALGVLALLFLAGTLSCGGSSDIEKGKQVFDANCATCHGAGALGTGTGPPLVHGLYVPGHHNDDSIRRAVRDGVPSHHWFFGDMPPIVGVSDEELEQVIAYVRERQREGGIY